MTSAFRQQFCAHKHTRAQFARESRRQIGRESFYPLVCEGEELTIGLPVGSRDPTP